MTTEEKAKAYDEALGRAKKFYNELAACRTKQKVAAIFPELAESEDERIRKALIEALTVSKSIGELKFRLPEPIREECITWLEKQKESSITSNDLDEEMDRFFDGMPIQEHENIFEDTYQMIARHFAKWGEKQKEQIPYIDFVIKPHKGDDNNPYDMRVSEAQEYAIKRGFGIPFNDGEVYVDERHMTQTIGNILRWADEHPKKQKPAEWSEEDEKMRDLIVAIFEVNHPNGFFKANELGTTDMRGVHTEEIISWLKSIRPQYHGDVTMTEAYKMGKEAGEASHWKPSEEQMEALESAVKLYKETHFERFHNRIESLYEDLKKL